METSHDNSTELLTPAEVGKALKVSGRTILNWEAKGLIEPAIRVGKVVRFNMLHVKARLAAVTDESNRLKQACTLPQNTAEHLRSEASPAFAQSASPQFQRPSPDREA
jgi:hypothetical protein